MKIKVLLPFLSLAIIIFAVGLACGPVTTPTATPQPPQVYPTNPPQVYPTNPPPPVVPSDTPASSPDFFTEEFTTDFLSDWSYFLMSGDEAYMSLTSGNDVLTFDLEGEDLWVYLMYDPYYYTDVHLSARVENRGKNNNNVSFICRYGDDGWYEFNIANNGLYWILAYSDMDNSYYTIFNGGSTAIKTGKDVNDYDIYCVGQNLALYINGVEVKTIKDTKYGFREGQIGIGVSSFDTIPIIVDWYYVDISLP